MVKISAYNGFVSIPVSLNQYVFSDWNISGLFPGYEAAQVNYLYFPYNQYISDYF